MAAELNYNDYKHPFMKKVANIEDFSRELLVKLAHSYEDALAHQPSAWCDATATLVGHNAAWDIAGKMYREGLWRPMLPQAVWAQPYGVDWKSFEHQAKPFQVDANDFTKPALIRYINSLQDQYVKCANMWLDYGIKLVGEEVGWNKICPLGMKNCVEYYMPSLSRVFDIPWEGAMNSIKLAAMSLDATKGYQGQWAVYSEDHVELKMLECEVLERYRDEGLYPPERAWHNCVFEEAMCIPYYRGVDFHIDLREKGELYDAPTQEKPYCVWVWKTTGK